MNRLKLLPVTFLGLSIAIACQSMAVAAPQSDDGRPDGQPIQLVPSKSEGLPLRQLEDVAAGIQKSNGKEKMQFTVEDPDSGRSVSIDINSKNLNYDPETGLYTATGEVYIIIPEEGIELLADEVSYSLDKKNMVAAGNVFILSGPNVVGSQKTQLDLEKKASFHENPVTMTEYVRIKGESATQYDKLTVLNDGRMIMDGKKLQQMARTYPRRAVSIGNGAYFSFLSASRAKMYLSRGFASFLNNDENYVDDNPRRAQDADILNDGVAGKPVSPRDIQNADFSDEDTSFRVKSKRISVYEHAKGFDEIHLKHTVMKYKNLPLAYIRNIEMGYIDEESYLAYLGPDIGYDVDYGGAYAGPGWDRQFLNGWVKFSPLVSFGEGRRVTRGNNSPRLVNSRFGVGALASYLSPNHRIQGGYNTTLAAPLLRAESRILGSSDFRVRVTMNEEYRNGFFSVERPNFMAEARHQKWHRIGKRLRLGTLASAGVARDEFFPNARNRFFVDPRSNTPITTSRYQLQGILQTTKPLVSFRDNLFVGALTQGRLAHYGTGDTFSLLQGGPFAYLMTGPLYTQATYLYGVTDGDTPFVFDSFYRGRNNLRFANAVDLGKHLTVGMSHNLNLDRDNARREAVIGRTLFFSAGPKGLKFSFAYDIIQKRSFFGITLNPDGGDTVMDFSQLNLYQSGYDPHNINYEPRESVVAPKKRAKKSKKIKNT